MKHHELIWGSALIAFIAWVFLAPSSEVRIERACTPIHWAGSGIVSLTALTAPKYEASAENAGNRVVYGCEYSVWRLFFQEKYDAWLASRRAALLGPQGKWHCGSALSDPKGSAGKTTGSVERSACHRARVVVSEVPKAGS